MGMEVFLDFLQVAAATCGFVGLTLGTGALVRKNWLSKQVGVPTILNLPLAGGMSFRAVYFALTGQWILLAPDLVWVVF